MLRILTIGIMLAGSSAFAAEGEPSRSAKDLAVLHNAMNAADKAALEQAADLSAADVEGKDAVVKTPRDDGAVQETVTVKKRHGVVQANTLWDMAKYYYENPWKWPLIYEANKHRIKDPHWIYPGQTFIIPGLEKMVTVVKELPRAEPEPELEPETQAPAPEEPEPLPEPEEEEEPAVYRPDQANGGIVLPQDLSVSIPKGMAGQEPAMYRMKMSEQWTPDGRVVEFRERESMAGAGDLIAVRIDAAHAVHKRQRYSVFRMASATEADVDPKGNYMQKAGLIEIDKRISGKEYQARILKSGGSLQVGDLLKLER